MTRKRSNATHATRLATIKVLYLGVHDPDGKHCVMEAVAYVANEPWTDTPDCTCPVIAAFLRNWNDALPNDDQRSELLIPLVPRVIGTRSTDAVETIRSLMAVDWLVRVHTPVWLRVAGLAAHADALESLHEITSMDQVRSMVPAIAAARRDAFTARTVAWAAARNADAARDGDCDAAWNDAWAVAWNATAGDAAWAAAWHAASGDAARFGPPGGALADARAAAVAAAGTSAATAATGADVAAAALAVASDAAWAAAWDAASEAAGNAAWAKLQPAVSQLQQSALALLGRMIEAK